MPAVDRCEPQIIRALEKEGWRVVRRHIPLQLGTDRSPVYADLRLQHDSQNILIVEIKCFDETPFPLRELYMAIGQYLAYYYALQIAETAEPLYLALPHAAYQEFVEWEAIQMLFTDVMINMIVVDLASEEIVQWIH